ncbi:MAG: cytochrome P450 [Patescibacteria group bacterium]
MERKPFAFAPDNNGHPNTMFAHTSGRDEQVCPVSIPVSGQPASILRTRPLVMAALTDDRVFSLARVPESAALTGTTSQHAEGMLRLDRPNITPLRRAMGPVFGEASIEQDRPRVRRVARGLIAEMQTGPRPADINTYCERFVIAATAAVNTISPEDSQKMFDLSNRVLTRVETPEEQEAVRQAWPEVYAHCAKMIEDKRREPDSGMLSQIITSWDRIEPKLTEDQKLHAMGTVMAGFFTPLGSMSVITEELLGRPDFVAACQENPALWEPVVDEVMRHNPNAHFKFALPRIVTEATEVAGHRFLKGEIVIPSLHAPMHDPEAAERPEEFDPDQRARRRLVFGAGPHLCPGADLSRQWLQIGIQELFDGFAGQELRRTEPRENLVWLAGSMAMPERLLVTWGEVA